VRNIQPGSENLLTALSAPETLCLWLFELDLPGGTTTMYFAKDNDAVDYRGHTYLPWPIGMDEPSETSKGEIGTLNVSFGCQDPDLMTLVQLYNGLEKCAMRVIQVFTLTDPLGCIVDNFVISKWAVAADRKSVAWTLATPFSIMQAKIAPRKYGRLFCAWDYKGHRCWPWSGSAFTTPTGDPGGAWTVAGTNGDTCGKTLEECRMHHNVLRFGGFPSIPSGQVLTV
jgi:lambda family phage minor tail protein L